MTKKHYVAIAAILIASDLVLDDITIELADYFEQDNKLFDRARFLTACGVETGCPNCGLAKNEWDKKDKECIKILGWCGYCEYHKQIKASD